MDERKVLLERIFGHELDDEKFKNVINDIEEHKYYVNEKIPFEINFDQALFSWYENIYMHIDRVSKSSIIKFVFPSLTKVNFYFFIMDHWHYLKKDKDDENIFLQEAISNYVKNYSERSILGKILYIFIN